MNNPILLSEGFEHAVVNFTNCVNRLQLPNLISESALRRLEELVSRWEICVERLEKIYESE